MGTWIIPGGFLDWLYSAPTATQAGVVSALDPITTATQSVNDGLQAGIDSAKAAANALPDFLQKLLDAWSNAEPWVIAAGIIVFLILIIVLLHQVGEVI